MCGLRRAACGVLDYIGLHQEEVLTRAPWLFRFLRARKGDVGNAADMFVAMIKWRRAMDIPGLLSGWADGTSEDEAAFAVLRDHWPTVTYGVDRRGIAVFYGR